MVDGEVVVDAGLAVADDDVGELAGGGEVAAERAVAGGDFLVVVGGERAGVERDRVGSRTQAGEGIITLGVRRHGDIDGLAKIVDAGQGDGNAGEGRIAAGVGAASAGVVIDVAGDGGGGEGLGAAVVGADQPALGAVEEIAAGRPERGDRGTEGEIDLIEVVRQLHGERISAGAQQLRFLEHDHLLAGGAGVERGPGGVVNHQRHKDGGLAAHGEVGGHGVPFVGIAAQVVDGISAQGRIGDGEADVADCAGVGRSEVGEIFAADGRN